MRATGTATADPKQAHPAAGPQTVAGDRFMCVFRAGWHMPAGIADEAGERQLIEPDQRRAEQAPRRLRPRARPVAGVLPMFAGRMIVGHPTARQPARRASSRSGRSRRPPHRRSAWSRRGGPCSRAPVPDISGRRSGVAGPDQLRAALAAAARTENSGMKNQVRDVNSHRVPHDQPVYRIIAVRQAIAHPIGFS